MNTNTWIVISAAVTALATALLATYNAKLARLASKRRRPGMEEPLKRLAAELDRYPVLREGAPDQLIGYDEQGMPG